MAVVEMSNQQADYVVQVSINYVKGMEPELYRAALCGSFEEITRMSDWKERVTPTGNNILHIHVGKPLNKAAIEFLREVLNDDGGSIAGYELLWKENDKGDTPLHLAARFGHKNVVELFLERANAVNPREAMRMLRMSNKMKDTPLHEAARADHVDVVKLLVEADNPDLPHEPNDMCETPLYLAAERGSASSVDIILDACHLSALAHPEGPCGRTPLHAAALWGNADMVQKILENNGKLMSVQDSEGLTPLHCAATERRKSQLLKVLLDYDSSNRNNESSTVYIKDNRGRTALHIAIMQFNWDAMKDLIAYCPDCIEIIDNNGQNVVHYAAKWHCVIKFKAFLKLGHFDSLVNGKDVQGNTPLHILAASILEAPYHGCLEETLRFLEYPLIDLTVFNRQNMTFSDIISSNESSIFERILRDVLKQVPRGKRINTIKDPEEANPADMAGLINHCAKAGETHMVVAALIATMSVTSAFTIPGGFIQNPGNNAGIAVLQSQAAFRIFLVSDILAFSLSIAAIIDYFGLVQTHSKRLIVRLSDRAEMLTFLSLGAMSIALVTGVYAMICHSPVLIILIGVITAVFFFFYIPFPTRLVRNRGRYYISCILQSREILVAKKLNDVLGIPIKICKFWIR